MKAVEIIWKIDVKYLVASGGLPDDKKIDKMPTHNKRLQKVRFKIAGTTGDKVKSYVDVYQRRNIG